MIRIDAAWLATAPLDMRAGTDTALARVVAVFCAAHLILPRFHVHQVHAAKRLRSLVTGARYPFAECIRTRL